MADYALSYVLSVSSAGDVDPSVRQQADEYAERLAEVDSNTIPIYLAQYYFLTGRTQEALDMVEQYVDYVSSDPETWQTAFDLLEQYEQDTDDYRTGVQYIAWKLDTWTRRIWEKSQWMRRPGRSSRGWAPERKRYDPRKSETPQSFECAQRCGPDLPCPSYRLLDPVLPHAKRRGRHPVPELSVARRSPLLWYKSSPTHCSAFTSLSGKPDSWMSYSGCGRPACWIWFYC